MTYTRFALMIVTSTVVMFVLMYLNTYAAEHVFFSETRTYMAILMGATMAFVMLAYMAAMYPSRKVNIGIFAGSVVVFALSLWLVRSQATVGGESYMRAMIPHHSIAIMTSERADIEDARVGKLAHEISAAQKKEIAEMRALIADLDAGRVVTEIYEDPEPQAGTVEDALNNTLLAELDLAPLTEDEAGEAVPGGDTCHFRRTRTEDPVLIAAADESGAAVHLNGVIIPLERAQGAAGYATEGLRLAVDPVEGWRSDSRLTFEIESGPTVAYSGFWSC
ncbi:hypothetical protein OB2597_01622 [Pseudooceanicola batsensis HTCC2597]|uniref:DUF305 domain-containing protein n=1 Tax=Pseudooceanicola batsensis (strain ATCC BAA-863 / DSM 15984 / KCTC 12145 / HTCC2597) TaxID=252305 RepID=A3U317_PSEBH|nr:DUF305 domain-containing protein [Pseudooceanicola batsensis]EAQ01547.1 hypothetical protein OB2597_01622 [Pseudooceanicola batsensis HTCC2597]